MCVLGTAPGGNGLAAAARQLPPRREVVTAHAASVLVVPIQPSQFFFTGCTGKIKTVALAACCGMRAAALRPRRCHRKLPCSQPLAAMARATPQRYQLIVELTLPTYHGLLLIADRDSPPCPMHTSLRAGGGRHPGPQRRHAQRQPASSEARRCRRAAAGRVGQAALRVVVSAAALRNGRRSTTHAQCCLRPPTARTPCRNTPR